MRKIHGIRAKALRVSQLTVRNKFRHLITFFHFTKSQIPLSLSSFAASFIFHIEYFIFFCCCRCFYPASSERAEAQNDEAYLV